MSGMPEAWRKHMTPDRAQELKAELESKTDWTGRCRWCGKELVGTLADMRKHREVCDGKKGS